MIRSNARRNRRGAVIVLIAILLPVLIAMVVFSVEVGRMYLVRSQLQTAVDAGALAAGLQLREKPDDVNDAVKKAHRIRPAESRRCVRQGSQGSHHRSQPGPGTPRRGHLLPTHARAGCDSSQRHAGSRAVFLCQGPRATHVRHAAIGHRHCAAAVPLDIIMTLDLSGSMGSQGRIEALQNAAPTFIEVLKDVGDNDRVGVMGYGAMISRYDPAAAGHNGTPYTAAPSSLYPSATIGVRCWRLP